MKRLTDEEVFAQGQAAMYQNALDALQAFVLRVKSSGTKVSPKVVDSALKECKTCLTQLRFNLTSNLMNTIGEYSYDTSCEDAWGITKLYNECGETLEKALVANTATFGTAIRFGGSFNGLSYLLDDVHGAMGLVVQQKAQTINWTFNGRDGRKLNCVRTLFLLYRHLIYRCRMLEAYTLAKEKDKTIEVKNYRTQETLLVVDAKDWELNELVIEKLFHFNSENEIVILP